ncbi:MAG TPA: DUF4268 domain-containing protein [Beijerinckiaceae bacterium]|jgi:hypothetical protein
MSGIIPTLGRLEEVNLREVWKNEATSFTPWLAQPENLQELARTLNLTALELIQTERSVQEFSADIVARVPDTDEIVLIENQLERSDHSHLGQILTYAAGVEARAIVWVAKHFTEGHRAALEWLNRKTVDDIAFFAVEVEAWRIGNSPPAPRFNVLVRPNDWARAARSAARGEISVSTPENIEYWEAFHAVAVAHGAPHRPTADPVKGTNYYVYLRDGSWIALTAYLARSGKSVGIYLGLWASGGRSDIPAIFEGLKAEQKAIESEIGAPLKWTEVKPGAVFHISKVLNADPGDRADWPRQHPWLADTMKRFSAAIEPRLALILAHAPKEGDDHSESQQVPLQ